MCTLLRGKAPLAILPLVAIASASCVTSGRRQEPLPPPPPPPGQALTPEPPVSREEEALPVQVVQEPIVVAAWAEPRELPAGGGLAQIMVRIQKEGGQPFPGVEVRLRASPGSLYSDGRILVTDARGMTRDRLTAHRTAVITLNAGGTRYRFRVPVGESVPPESP